jgi:hypothetical protein
MMEAARTSETSVDIYFTRQYIPEDKSAPYMSVLKQLVLVDLQEKVGELFLPITASPTIIILENTSN